MKQREKRPNPVKQGHSKGNPYNGKTRRKRGQLREGFMAMQDAEGNYMAYTRVPSKKNRRYRQALKTVGDMRQAMRNNEKAEE